MREKFKLWHSLVGLALLLCVESLLLHLVWVYAALNANLAALVLLCALVGGAAIVVLAAEVIEEVRNAVHMLTLLSGVMLEFIVFFAFQYYFLLAIEPGSFANLTTNPVNLFLHSTMIFVFNPLYLPTTSAGQGLLLINTLGAVVLVLFIVQNIWQFRTRDNNRL